MLTNVYKAYNVDTCKAVHITGYHLIKWLAHNTGLHASTLQWAMRDLKRKGNVYINRLSIDRI